MESYLLHCKAGELCFEIPSNPRNPREKLLAEIELISGNKRFNEPISRIKFKGNYSRKLIVQVFSELDVKVTRYTREYGRTIVHFEDASDSES